MILASCPSCHKTVNDDFGLATCQACGQVFLVNIDGSVELNTAEPEDSIPDVPTPEISTEEIIPDEMMSMEDQLESDIERAFEADSEYDFEASSDETKEPLSDEVNFDEPPNDNFSNDPIEDSYEPAESEINESISSIQPDEEEPPVVVAKPIKTDPNDPLQINAFVNSELAQLDGGTLLYDITIKNIDTAEMREILSFNLEDERFAWDHKSLMKKIKKGALLIENLNPIKAHVLISRLRFEDFNLSWNQKIVTNTDLEGEVPSGVDSNE